MRGKDNRIINVVRDTGEPVFIIRAQDMLSSFILAEYERLVEQYSPYGEMAEEIAEIRREFKEWQRANASSVKFPD